MFLRHFYKVLTLMVIVSVSGCSLLEVKLDSQTTPLTKQELNMRILTREYAQLFFTQVEQSADEISATYDSQDTVHQSYVLLWKINAEEGLQSAAYQASPTAALIDSWVFTYQMDQFFQSEAGSTLFLGDSAQATSARLLTEIDALAKSLLKGDVYRSSKEFVEQFSSEQPFTDLTFFRTPAYRPWLAHSGIAEDEAVTTLGTMPEAMGDVSDRLSLVTEQTPKIMNWKAQLIAMNSSVSGEEFTATMESFRKTSESFQDFVANNPEYMRNLAEQMAIELQPLVNDIDAKTDAKLVQLSGERAALEAMVARERAELVDMIERERKAIAVIVATEREKFTQDIDKVSQDVLTLAMDKLVSLIKSTIIYFVLFIIAIFFAPLGLGYMLGKRAAVKAK
ncbi:chemotaxis protein [Vibrio sp. SCSIO 43135]|uniref:chemotaxis protein n=1 Tax=Vibrio sp. SCSIO 43135 TaxID=2819096 RepID=UPI0020750D78|nr:chemotaxis protein [Vibrio sp. SCSIO 43135]USD41957.1 chemotaxis protein [Vibrio sp. SCSIO 43135]